MERGEQCPQTSKTAWLTINFIDSLEDTMDYPKRGHKKGRREEGRGHREDEKLWLSCSH